MDAGYVVGIIGGVAAVIFGILAVLRNNKQDNRNNGKQEGAVLTELGYIKSGVDDIKLEQREQRKFNADVTTKLAANEVAIARAHSRLDRLEKHEDIESRI